MIYIFPNKSDFFNFSKLSKLVMVLKTSYILSNPTEFFVKPLRIVCSDIFNSLYLIILFSISLIIFSYLM